MINAEFNVTGTIQAFPGKGGWWYLPLPEDMSADLRELVRARWPALLSAEFTLNTTTWKSAIMPIKDGPLFIALKKEIRTKEKLSIGDEITISFTLLSD